MGREDVPIYADIQQPGDNRNDRADQLLFLFVCTKLLVGLRIKLIKELTL
jgi:hypothetical protein